MDNFITSPDIFDDLHTRFINCCRNVRQNYKGMPRGFNKKILKLKWVDTCQSER
jgi:hypothetical protein